MANLTRVTVAPKKFQKHGIKGPDGAGTFKFRGQTLQKNRIYKISETDKSVKTVEFNAKEKRVQILDHTK